MNSSTPPGFTLRFASADDARAMAELSRDSIEHGLSWRYRPSRMEAFARDPEHVALVADCVDGSAESFAGFAVMHFRDERAHLVLLAVEPGMRQRGLARAMLAWLIRSARVAGVSTLHVEMRESNRRALSLYRAAGFVPSLRMAGYYEGKENAVRMLLVLRPPTEALPEWELPAAFRRR